MTQVRSKPRPYRVGKDSAGIRSRVPGSGACRRSMYW